MKKVYLNTVEEVIKSLKNGESVYSDTYEQPILYMIDGIIISEYKSGNKFINSGSIEFKENKLYRIEKEPIKMEVGKFYKTREGDKAVCLNKDKAVGNPDEYIYMIHCIGFPCHYWTYENGKKEKHLVSDLDIVDYWEEQNGNND